MSRDVSVFLNQGDGTFSAGIAYQTGNWLGSLYPTSIAIEDVDGVGGPDLVVGNLNRDSVAVLLNNGDGTFDLARTYRAGDGPTSVAIGNLDNVNGLDLAVANAFGDDVSILLNRCPVSVCPGDCGNADGEVGAADFLSLLAQWGVPGAPCDLDGDGVGITDLQILFAEWGTCP